MKYLIYSTVALFGCGPRFPRPGEVYSGAAGGGTIPDGVDPFVSMAYYASWAAGLLVIVGFLGIIFSPEKRIPIQAVIGGFGLLMIAQVMLWVGTHMLLLLILLGITTIAAMVYVVKRKPNLVEDVTGIDIPGYGDDGTAKIRRKEAEDAHQK